MKHLTVFLSLILFALTPAFGQSLESQISEEIELKLELSRLMIESADRIDLEVQKQFTSKENPFDQPVKLASIIRNEAENFQEFFEESLHIEKEKVPLFRKIYSNLHWEKIVPLMKKAHVGAEVFFKRKGIGLGLAIMIGKSVKFTLIYALMKYNMSQYTPIVMSIPWSATFAMIPKQIEKFNLRQKLIKNLGGKEGVEAYKKQEESMLKVLSFQNPKDLIIPITDLGEGEIEAVVLSNAPVWKKLMVYINMPTDDITLANLKDFLRENKIETPYIDWILSQRKMRSEQKRFHLITHIFSQGNFEIELKFRQRFQSQFIKARKKGNWNSILTYAARMKKLRTLEEVMEETRKIPADLTPKDVALIWENVLLDEYVNNMDLTYKEARTMFVYFESFKGKMYSLPDNINYDRFQHEMFTFMEKLLQGKKFNGCVKTPAEVEAYLLKRAAL